MVKIILKEFDTPKCFWVKAVNTFCYILNRVTLKPELKKTPFKLWRDRKPNILYFKVLDLKFFTLNTKDNFDKFDSKSNIDIFRGYSFFSKAYKVYNNRILCLEESMHVAFEESQNDKIIKILDDINESVQYLSLNNKNI
jgi:hypothetical protein